MCESLTPQVVTKIVKELRDLQQNPIDGIKVGFMLFAITACSASLPTHTDMARAHTGGCQRG